MSNSNVNINVVEENNMNILERSKLALQQYEEAVALVKVVEELNNKIAKAEAPLVSLLPTSVEAEIEARLEENIKYSNLVTELLPSS